jgi:uncharacterized protein (DUF1697 family)
MGRRPQLKYVAFLRAVNVGGKNVVRMADVRTCLEGLGFARVRTYIQSGNILFESDLVDTGRLTTKIEKAYSATLKHDAPVFLRSEHQLRKIVAQAPREWTGGRALRRSVAFLRKPLTVTQVLTHIQPRPGVDTAKAGDSVVYLSTVIARLNQSGFPKIIRTPMYRTMTIRSFRTCQKILALMEANG